MEIFENTLKHIIWKPLKPMGKFENTLKTIETYGKIWKHFETEIWKPLKTMGKFENTLKHIIWKLFESCEEIWKHFVNT